MTIRVTADSELDGKTGVEARDAKQATELVRVL